MTEENIVEPKIRVLVVDDSAIMRRIITTALKMDPGIEVVGIAEDGLISKYKSLSKFVCFCMKKSGKYLIVSSPIFIS